MSTSRRLTIPTPEELRAEIKARAAELRAKRKLLKLAEAADAARQATDNAMSMSIQPTPPGKQKSEGDRG
jgi:hypothetical protein